MSTQVKFDTNKSIYNNQDNGYTDNQILDLCTRLLP